MPLPNRFDKLPVSPCRNTTACFAKSVDSPLKWGNTVLLSSYYVYPPKWGDTVLLSCVCPLCTSAFDWDSSALHGNRLRNVLSKMEIQVTLVYCSLREVHLFHPVLVLSTQGLSVSHSITKARWGCKLWLRRSWMKLIINWPTKSKPGHLSTRRKTSSETGSTIHK